MANDVMNFSILYNESADYEQDDWRFDVYLNYKQLTAMYQLMSCYVLMGVCVVGAVLLVTVLLSAFFVRRWESVVKFTYSMVIVDIISLICYAMLLLTINLLKMHLPCTWMLIQAMRVGGIMCTLEHIALLALQHCLAVALPMKYREIGSYLVWPGLLIVWLLPYTASLASHIGMAVYSDDCMSPLFQHDYYRYAQIVVSVSLMLMTVLCYLHLMWYSPKFSSPIIQIETNAENKKLTVGGSDSNLKPRTSLLRISLSRSGDTIVNDVAMMKNPKKRRSVPKQLRIRNKSMVSNNSRVLRRRRKTVHFAMIMLIVFCISWMPAIIWYAVLCQTCYLTPYYMMEHHPYILLIGSLIVNLLLMVKYCVNAFIYSLRVPEIRKGYQVMFCGAANSYSQDTTSSFNNSLRNFRRHSNGHYSPSSLSRTPTHDYPDVRL